MGYKYHENGGRGFYLPLISLQIAQYLAHSTHKYLLDGEQMKLSTNNVCFQKKIFGDSL